MFKFALGAAVMLSSSVAAYEAQRRNDERELDDSSRMRPSQFKIMEFIPPIEAGEVIGRAEYVSAEPSYLVRYRGGDGRQVEHFIGESALVLDPRPTAKPAQTDGDNSGNYFEAKDKVTEAINKADMAPADSSSPAEIRISRTVRSGDREISHDITIPLVN